jgi:uncharacterized membrane-anchored protein
MTGMTAFDDELPTAAPEGANPTGPARVGSPLRALIRRLRPGDVAVIDVMDLDRGSAAAMVQAGVAGVVNARPFLSGRYPAGGARVLAEAGVPMVDRLGPDILGIKDGTVLDIDGAQVKAGGSTVAAGTRLTSAAVESAMSESMEGMRVQLASFTANAMDHVERDAPLLLDGTGLPEVDIDLDGRHVLLVTGGFGHADQLQQLRRYIRERRPIVIAVADGADAARSARLTPALIVGNVEHVAEKALTSATHVVVHDSGGGNAGLTRVEALGVSHTHSESGLASEDIALLIAHTRGASVIVTVGMAATLVDFLEEDRSEVAGTFLARLQTGGRVIDAEALAQVYRHRYSTLSLTALMVCAIATLGVALWVTPGGRLWLEDIAATVATWIGVGS